MRESFLFRRAYWDFIKDLPNERQLKMITAVLNFALDNINPPKFENEKDSLAFACIAEMIKIDNKRRDKQLGRIQQSKILLDKTNR